MRTLIVYYSRNGMTRDLANAIQKELGADIEEIADPTPRSGPLGYMRCVLESAFQQKAAIRSPAKNPRDYDLVIVGTPVWAGNMSSPVRAYLSKTRDRLPKVAFFCTMGGVGNEHTFQKMGELCQKSPVAELALRDGVRWKQARKDIANFAAAAQKAVGRGTTAAERGDNAPAAFQVS